MKKKLLTFVLLFAMSFSVVHAFVIDAFDTHSCQTSEYVEEFSKPIHNTASGDICDIHYEFHTAFILPKTVDLPKEIAFNDAPLFFQAEYEFSSVNKLLRPPKN